MRKILLAVALVVSTWAHSQTTLVKIGDSSYSLEEFEYIYNKNSSNSQLPISKEEYLELFINYKLKVAEAHSLGLDTNADLLSEIAELETELVTPYLQDTSAVTAYAQMLKSRLDEEIDASHILISVKPDAPMSEVTKAYERAKAARDRVLSGEDFNAVASKVSEDPSAKVNGGRLGYFSALRMVTEFEDMAYSSKVGDVTDIFRTSFGWHFMKIHDRRPYSGKIQVAHIMKGLPRNASQEMIGKARQQVDSLYERIKAGDDFSELAMKYSDDRQSAQYGGVMPWFGKNEIVAPFGGMSFALKADGDVSEPFATPFGLHIVKRLSLKTTIPNEEKESIIKTIMRSGQHPISNISTTSKVSQLKSVYGYKLNEAMSEEVINIMNSDMSDSAKICMLRTLPEPLAIYNGGTVEALAIKQKWDKSVLPSANFDKIAQEVLFKLEGQRLARENTTYKYTMQEYKDGFLVFEINQRYIWQDLKDKADTTKLVSLYENNQARYSKTGSFDGDIYFFSSKKDCKKAKKNNSLASKLAFKVVSGKQEKGGIYDDIIWGILPSEYVLVVGQRTEAEVLPYEQVKSRLIADYHQLKEQEYVNTLREKYNPKVVSKLK